MNIRFSKSGVTHTGKKLLCALAAIILSIQASVLPAEPPQDIPDADIVTAIDNQLWRDEAVSMHRLNVSSDDGIVTFTGTVDNILAKERAEEIASITTGVRGVINRINVLPPERKSDRDLRISVMNALQKDPVTEAFELDASVGKGTVTLTGTVDSRRERQLAADVVKGVEGVIGIINKVDVEPRALRPDDEIITEIRETLRNDVRVDEKNLELAINDGHVSVYGSVGSLAEKYRVIHDAWVAGVRTLDTDNLEVKWWVEDGMNELNRADDMSDAEIRRAVKDAFINDPRIFSPEPEINVNNGTVILTGIVSNLRARNAAEEIARNIIGVYRVKNHLKVRPEVTRPDDEIEQALDERFARDPYISYWEVNKLVSKGRVYLTGNVDSLFEKTRAGLIASSIKGVTDVNNNIEYNDEWSGITDRELAAEVRDELFWSVFVDLDDINVSVDNGTVILSGEVDSWREYQAAVENTRQAGAKDIENRLEVEYAAR